MTDRSRRPDAATSGDRTYDAIVVGGGHNGLVNGAYLAKAGLRTLILERRHLVGGAAITEELRPGFWFTTFSYALSLLRPDIIQDLELTKHGFMPLLMSTTFAPMEDGDYLLLGQDHDENQQGDRPPQPARRRRLRRSTATTWTWSARRIKPLLDQVAARHLQRRPRGADRAGRRSARASSGSTSASSTTRSGC